MDEQEIADFTTDTYLIERLRKFELDQWEADRAARAALWRGLRNALLIEAFIGAVCYGVYCILK